MLTVELAGFRQYTQQGLVLVVGQRIELAITLQVGQLAESLTVTATAPLIRTANAEIAELIDNRQVEQLPLNGRQFVQLAQLTDGVTIPPGGTRGAALGQAGPLPNVYGQRGGHNIYLIDGVKVTDEYFNNLVISPSVDAIQEFKISKTQYPAEFGGKASALVNVVTKSGGNEFHGSALGFFRNESLDAHNFFDDPSKPVPDLRQNQFGVNLGGPLKRNRTFFYFSYEGLRFRKAQTQVFSVPTAGVAEWRLRRPAAGLRSADQDRNELHGISRQPDSCEPYQLGGSHAPRQGVGANQCWSHGESARRGRPEEHHRQLQHPRRSSHRQRDSLGPLLDVPCRGRSAVRHDVTERSTRTRIRTVGNHQGRESRRRAHPRARRAMAQRSPLRLPVGSRRPGQPEPGLRLRRRFRTARRRDGSAGHGVSAGVVRRPIQHDGRSGVVRVARRQQL